MGRFLSLSYTQNTLKIHKVWRSDHRMSEEGRMVVVVNPRFLTELVRKTVVPYEMLEE